MDCTYSSGKPVEITSEALMDSVKKMAVYHRPHFESKHPKWFERLMNRFGLHRNPEIFIVKDSSFRVSMADFRAVKETMEKGAGND